MAEVFISPPDRHQERVQSSSPVVDGVVHAEPLDPANDEESTSRRSSRHKLRDACTAHLDRKEFVYSVVEAPGGDPDRSLIKAGIGGENGSYQLLVDIKEAPRNVVIIYVLSSLKFPKPRRAELCEYVTRANYQLVLGNFELDLDDGEVRYKCSTVVGPEGLSHEVLERMMPAALGTMDRYFANMVKVGYGIMDPKQAVEEVEQAGSSSASSSSRQQQALMDALATAVSVDDSATTTTTTCDGCSQPIHGADDDFDQ